MPLPKQFSDLEVFVEKWDLPNTNARYSARFSSSMNELSAFHRAIMKHAEEIKQYLDSKNFGDFSDEDKSLARMTLALPIVGAAVEVFRQPTIPDSGATNFRITTEREPW